MKKYTFVFAMFLFPLLAFADGGFLNADVVVSNYHGGNATPGKNYCCLKISKALLATTCG